MHLNFGPIRMKKLSTTTGVSLFLFLFCISLFAEQLQVNTAYTDQTNEVSFVVTLPSGVEVPPKSSDFQLFDGSAAIISADAIEPFAESDRKLVLLFSVDVSRSISNDTLRETQAALINIFSITLPKDRYQFGLVSFADEVIGSPFFTDDPETFTKSIRELKIAHGNKTVLYQATIDSLNKLEELMPGEYRRILIISDGKDEGSVEDYDTVINLSKSRGIPIDGIAINGISPQYNAPEKLSALAEATGGHFIHPRNQSMSLKEAVISLYDSAIENTWIVHFRYQPNTEKPKLKNVHIKFKQNDTINLSANFSESIPAPSDFSISEDILTTPSTNTTVSNEDNWSQEIKGKFNNPSTYWVLGLLLLVTLIFILWIFQRRKKTLINGDAELSTDHEQLETGSPNHNNLFTTGSQQPKEESSRRQTVISSDLKDQDRPSIALEVTEGPLEGKKIPMDKPMFRIGANQDNDLVLIDDYVSRNHASLTYNNSDLILSDLNSRNGTMLNGVLMNNRASVVLPGDVIRIGNTSLIIITS